jgi:hypothetical protein
LQLLAGDDELTYIVKRQTELGAGLEAINNPSLFEEDKGTGHDHNHNHNHYHDHDEDDEDKDEVGQMDDFNQ